MAVRNFSTSSIKSGVQRRTIWDQAAGGIPVTGYRLWLDANDTSTITLSGSAVTQWNDKSANTYQFTQGTSSRRPTSGLTTINGRNVLDFDGTDHLASTASASTWSFLHDGTKTTQFYVVKRNATSNGTNVLTSTNHIGASAAIAAHAFINDSTNYPGLSIHNGTSGDAVVRLDATADTAIGTNTTVITYATDPGNSSSGDRAKVYVNNGSAIGNNTWGQTPSTSAPYGTLLIGDLGPGIDIGLKGKFAEIIIYPFELTTTQRNSVRDYLIGKWGI